MKLEKDTTISHYKILSEIGKGGMGEVYLAHDTKLNRQVAIKDSAVMNSANDSEQIESFCAGSSICLGTESSEYYYYSRDRRIRDGTHYIATEYIEGKTLNNIRRVNILSLIQFWILRFRLLRLWMKHTSPE